MIKTRLKVSYKEREVELKDLCQSYNCAQAILSLNEKLLEAYIQDGNGDAPEVDEFKRCIEDKTKDIESIKRRLNIMTGSNFTEYHIFAFGDEIRVYNYWSTSDTRSDYKEIKPMKQNWVQLELF